MNVEELISKIKKRPGMYVGCMELEPIVHFINGFTFNNVVSGKVDLVEEKFKEEFHEWTRKQLERKFNVNLERNHNYLFYINQVSSNSNDSLKLFFELCDVFFYNFHSEEKEADGDSGLNADGSIREAPYSYLCQQGFVSSNRVRVTIKWRTDLSKSSQILILKNIYPVFKEVPVRILLEEARRNEEQWEFAEMWWGQAVDIMELAKEKGLDILIEEIEV